MKSEKGFTLVELVLVIALLVISVGVSSDIIVSLIRSYSKTQIINEVEQSANFVLLKIEQELRDATSVTVPNSSTLVFSNRDGNTITYTLSGDILLRDVDGDSHNLTDNTGTGGGVAVTCPAGCFNLISANPGTVGVNITFSQTGLGLSKIFTGDISLNEVIVARGTY